jgi:nucleoside-diphosphate-sugar epimerase
MRSKIKNKNIFITGGTGFIGSWIIDTLVDDNKIWCYDNCRRVSPKFEGLLKHKNLKFIKGDILDKAKLKKSLPKKLDMVFHLAAIAGVSSYYKMPFETMSINLIGTYNLLELVKDRDLEIFVDFSTSEVYGKNAREVGEESDTAQGPISDLRWTYAISKLAAEELSHCYHHKYGLPTVSIRPFNIYGPLQIGEGAIQIFTRNAIENKEIIINGDGSQVRAWCYIEDFLDGVFRSIDRKKTSVGNTFNIGNSSARATTLELARIIMDLCGSDSKIRFKPMANKDIEYRVPDISKAKKLLGYSPSIGIREGLKRSIEWYRQNPL